MPWFATILIADDDAVQRRLVENMVQRCGYEAVTVDSGDGALAHLIDPDTKPIDAMVLDLVMPGLDGMGVLEKIRDLGLDLAGDRADRPRRYRQCGVRDARRRAGFRGEAGGRRALAGQFAQRPQRQRAESELQRIRHRREGKLTFADIVTRSEAMSHVIAMGKKAAASAIPVLIEGESGVGKELIARAIHGSSERSAKPFITVNCGAIPDNLVESLLFGHEKGSFTGATERHAGKFVEANGGTLFLDEISELPLAAQVKLLRALQQGEVEAVGGRKPVKVDVRIVSATNRNLLNQVKAGAFREDLFYRLHVLPLTIPPLRARREDIPHLVRHFMARSRPRKTGPPHLSAVKPWRC